jgi:hypothetical protein
MGKAKQSWQGPMSGHIMLSIPQQQEEQEQQPQQQQQPKAALRQHVSNPWLLLVQMAHLLQDHARKLPKMRFTPSRQPHLQI